MIIGNSTCVTDELRQKACFAGLRIAELWLLAGSQWLGRITTDPSGKILIICLPKIKDALCMTALGVTLRSLIVNSLSQKNATIESSQLWKGIYKKLTGAP
jgi:hypothetical protein